MLINIFDLILFMCCFITEYCALDFYRSVMLVFSVIISCCHDNTVGMMMMEVGTCTVM